MAALQVEIVRIDALCADDWALWADMVKANPDLASPYFDPRFTRIAGRISPRAAVAVFRKGAETVGFFPHQRRGAAVLPLAAPMNDYHGVIARPGEAPSLEDVARLLDIPRLSVSAWIGAGDAGETRTTMMAELPEGGFAPWYAERRKTFGKFFKDKERARRSMEAEFGPMRVEHGLRDPAMLDTLIDLKREQYRRTGRHDVFACGWTADLLHGLMSEHDGDFGGAMAALWAGDKLCAVEYSLLGGAHYHFWFPAYVPELARCSPGILLTLDTMELASPDGFRVFDFGFGGEHYKKYFCNAEMVVREAAVLRPGVGANLSQAAVAALNLAGEGRGERLRTSVRRRWAAIEACETDTAGRLKGAVAAAGAALAKATRNPSARVPA
ncbi:GNAT family N-acetyltransferase [Rhizobium sp. CRIBSB]|nr:GNAT family N-acetyltransferase [Rhizobium sp. CRIBSB]